MKPKDFIDLLKLPPNILLATSMVSGIMLFSPSKVLEKLYIINFMKKYGGFVSLIFLISASLLIILSFTGICKYFKKIYLNKKIQKSKIKLLLNLEDTEVKTIKKFISNNTHTLSLVYNDGMTQKLNALEIITLAGDSQCADICYNNKLMLKYFLQPWVITLINSNDNLRKKYK